jgi:hypothetical protein
MDSSVKNLRNDNKGHACFQLPPTRTFQQGIVYYYD